jgi:hypothetical protein
MDATNMIHIKARMNDDFRRFQCKDDFATVLSTLRTLFHIPEQDTFLIKFLDDEGDLCTISTQIEFEFAVAHSELLKITLFQNPAVPQPAAPIAEAIPCRFAANPKTNCLKERLAAVTAKLALPNLPPHKVQNLNKRKQFLEAKLGQLAENPDAEVGMPAWKQGCGLENRLAGINAKLQKPDLTPEKKERLLSRKQMLEAKLEQRKTGDHCQFPKQERGCPKKMHCGPAGANLENRLAWINAKLAQPDLPKEKVEKLTQRKQFLEAKLQQQQATPQDAASPRGRSGGSGNNLENRLAWIKTKLEQPDLPPHKVEKLTHRKEMLEAKLAQKNGSAATPADAERCHWKQRGARAGCGARLEAKIAMLEENLQQPDLPEHKREKFVARLAWLQEKLQAKQVVGDEATTEHVMPSMCPRRHSHPMMPHHGPHPMMPAPMYHAHGYHAHPHGHHHGPHAHGPYGHHHGPHHAHHQAPAHCHRGGFCRK